MDYKKAAEEVLEKIGGSDNIISVAHCATRLRIVTGDNSKYSKKAVENIDGVKGVFEASGQLQIIFGTGAVNKVYGFISHQISHGIIYVLEILSKTSFKE